MQRFEAPSREETIPEAAARLEAELAALGDWSARLAYVRDLGRALDGLDAARRSEGNKVKGCQSQVWLVVERQRPRLRFAADSDALIMRGLLALVLRVFQDRRPDEILAHPAEVLDGLALAGSLAPGRANGLHLVVRRIRAAAAELEAARPRRREAADAPRP